MKRKRTYRAARVKGVDWEQLSQGRDACGVVGFDVGKLWIVAVVRWEDGQWERPWWVENPGEIGVLVALLAGVARERSLRLAMEPTGTYGDLLRQALWDAGLPLERVAAKAAHDYAEVFDGVPSQHDGQDAAVVAELPSEGQAAREQTASDSEVNCPTRSTSHAWDGPVRPPSTIAPLRPLGAPGRVSRGLDRPAR